MQMFKTSSYILEIFQRSIICSCNQRCYLDCIDLTPKFKNSKEVGSGNITSHSMFNSLPLKDFNYSCILRNSKYQSSYSTILTSNRCTLFSNKSTRLSKVILHSKNRSSQSIFKDSDSHIQFLGGVSINSMDLGSYLTNNDNCEDQKSNVK